MHLSRETKALILLASFSLFCLVLLRLTPDVRATKSSSFIGRNSTTTASPTVTPSPEFTIRLQPTIPPTSGKDELKIYNVLEQAFGSKDVDCDGIENIYDNCPLAFNPKQEDREKDGIGDVCDTKTGGSPDLQDRRCDQDGDGVLDRDDNCILVCNPKQEDRNKDGVGDACDYQLNPNFARIVHCTSKSETPNCKRSNSRKPRAKKP